MLIKWNAKWAKRLDELIKISCSSFFGFGAVAEIIPPQTEKCTRDREKEIIVQKRNETRRTARNVGKSTPANFPAVRRHGRNERHIVIINATLMRCVKRPDFCQSQKYAYSRMLPLCNYCCSIIGNAENQKFLILLLPQNNRTERTQTRNSTSLP